MIHPSFTEERHKRVPNHNMFQPLVDLDEETSINVEENLERKTWIFQKNLKTTKLLKIRYLSLLSI